ncbi:MAG: HEAT repeat domain-containing protein [Deltaproteobacteria bacterium]|nr:HEAT repeat domain-containing protein [Deltaproteobacteria bacterium]
MASPFLGHFEKVQALAATPRLLAVGGRRARGDSAVTIFDHVSNKPKATLPLACAVNALAVGKGGWYVGGDDGVLRKLDDEGKVTGEVKLAASIAAIALHGDHAALALRDGSIALVDGSLAIKGTRTLSSRRLRAIVMDANQIAAAGDDGVIRLLSRSDLAAEAKELAGHDGSVAALAFLPRDGRLASGGDDGTIKLWYLTGAPDCETRGADSSGHAGGVRGLVHVSSGDAAVDGTTTDRLYTVGADGMLKAWRLEDRKKPRTDEVGEAFSCLCVVEKQGKPGAGQLFFSGDSRKVRKKNIDGPNDWESSHGTLADGFERAKDAFTGAKPKREEAVNDLAKLDDDEAMNLLEDRLKSDKEADVRNLVITGLATRDPAGLPARTARRVLKAAVDDADAKVRVAAVDALHKLEPEDAFAAPRAGLQSRHPDLRIRSLRQLAERGSKGEPGSAVVPGLLTKKLVDSDAAVAAIALEALLAVSKERTEALRTGLLRGNATVRLDALVRSALLGHHRDPAVSDLFARAFDDDDVTTRERAFTLATLLRKPLAFLKKDASFGRRSIEIGRRVAQLESGNPSKKIDDAEAEAALAKLPQDGSDKIGVDDERPLLLALASRLPDTAMRGAWVLANLGDVRALGALLQLTRHPEADVRKSAAALLSAYKNDDARTRLVWLFDDAAAPVRAAAFDAFAAGEPDKRAVADVALRSSHEDIRVRGLDALLTSAKDGKTAEHEALLQDALEDESAKVRGEAFKTLWSFAVGSKEPALVRAMQGRFADTRRRAVDELLAISDAWAEGHLVKAIADLDAGVATAAYEGLVKRRNPVDDSGKRKHDIDNAEAHLAGLASSLGSLRALAAKGARRCKPDEVRSALMKQILDDDLNARINALEALDALLPNENGPLVSGLVAKHYDVKVRAGELLALRRDDALLDAMKLVVSTKDELLRLFPADYVSQLRRRAAAAIATLGKPSTVKYLATELMKDDDPGLREEAARGLATACRRGDEGYLLEAVGHKDVWVRSWAGEGLARLGDARCLPVLVGTLRHENLAIRRGAVLSFSAFGAEGYAGLLQGLDDDNRELEELVFSIVLSHDLLLARRGESPTLLAASLSAARPEVRYAAARALELRADVDAYTAHLVEVLGPEKPEKVSDMKGWPEEATRARLMVSLAEALGSPIPEQRYAAASALLHKANPKAFFKAAEDAVKMKSLTTPWTPDNRPRVPEATESGGPATSRVKGFLRRVFSPGSDRGPAATTTPANVSKLSPEEQLRLRLLAFGAYVGLLRQATSGDDAQRVRRDAVDRIVELGSHPMPLGVGRDAALPALTRALDDGQHLVRKAALAGLKKLFQATGASVDDALTLALRVPASDVAKAALEELAERGQTSRVEQALNSPVAEVRKLAFETLEKRAAKGSIAHLVLALKSEHDDLRLSVLEQLAKRKDDKSVGDALAAALDSEHKGLVLRAAEVLAEREDERCVDALITLAKSEDEKHVARAREALSVLGNKAATAALLSLVDEPGAKDLPLLAECLGATKRKETLETLAKLTDHAEAPVRNAAFEAGLVVVGKTKKKRDDARAAAFFPVAVKSKDMEIKKLALKELAWSGKGSAADDAVVAAFSDREIEVRVAAVACYAERARKTASPTGPLEDVVKKGARELALGACEGLAMSQGHKAASLALVPLLLVSRAGEGEDRSRALIAVGRLGDPRALPELELIADGGTEEAPAEPDMMKAALEGLGRLHNSLSDMGARARIWDRVEAGALDDDNSKAYRAVRGLRAIGDERAKAMLVRVLDNDPSDDVVKEACEAIASLEVKEAEGALADKLESWNDDVRKAARHALDKLFPKDRTRVELHVLDHANDDDEKKKAANYLAAEGDAAVLLPRLSSLEDDELRARLRVGLLRRESLPLPPLVALLASTKIAAVTEGAAVVAGRTWSTAEAKTLADALLAAEALLKKQNDDGGEAEDDSKREAAWIAVIGSAAHVDVSRAAGLARTRLGEHLPASIRRALLAALGRGGSTTDIDLLVTALGDPEIGCRVAAAQALRALAGKDAWNRGKGAAARDPHRFVDVMPADAGLLKDANARPALLPLLLNSDTEALTAAVDDKALRRPVIDALSRSDNDEVREKLSELARDDGLDEATRKAAYRSLRRSMRLQTQRGRQKKTTDALPSWKGAVNTPTKTYEVAQ